AAGSKQGETGGRSGCGFVGRKFQMDIELTRDAGLVDDRAIRYAKEPCAKLIETHPLSFHDQVRSFSSAAFGTELLARRTRRRRERHGNAASFFKPLQFGAAPGDTERPGRDFPRLTMDLQLKP